MILDDLDTLVCQAVRELFSMMLDLEITRIGSESIFENGKPHVAASVGLAGDFSGVVFLHSSEEFARRMAGRLLHESAGGAETDEMINDVMGELTNVIAGHMKSRINDRGCRCAITIPSIVRGSEFKIQTIGIAERIAVAFECDKSRILVEVIVRDVGD
ncbi:MAG: chemotaxis protein CheX [Verrucomicrobia bacterium]|nr:chemotaxis protein CheX [Verrucomicrobiota bacterium]MCF7707280.1 chemotaxis protein CheX [Verrucomicrobiota bacterium]